MRRPMLVTGALALGAVIALGGCGHRLAANHGESTVAMYPDEDTYSKLANLKRLGGLGAMFGDLGERAAAKQVDNNTPVKILSRDDKGAEVEVLDGAFKGQRGFVPKENVD